jgi:hypothetical protein
MTTPADDARIVPPYSTSGVQHLVDKASRAYQELIVAMPRDQASKIEALKFLDSERAQTIEYFYGAPN